MSSNGVYITRFEIASITETDLRQPRKTMKTKLRGRSSVRSVKKRSGRRSATRTTAKESGRR